MAACVHCGLAVPALRRDEFCCFGCRVAHEVLRPGAAPGESRALPSLRTRLVFGAFIAMNVMALNFSFYAPDLFGPDAVGQGAWGELSSLFGYLMLFLATLVIVLLGLPLLVDALQHESGRRLPRPSAQLLIVAGVLAAYALSAWYTVTGAGRPYYDTATLVLVVVTLGHYVEARAKRAAARSMASALDALPDRVEVQRGEQGGEVVEIDAAELAVGDIVRVKPGDAAAVDGIVLRGASHLDARSLTGESRPLSVAPGDRVLAGSLSLDGELWVEARRVGVKRTLEQVETLLEQARSERPRAQRLADRIAAVFAPAVVLLALGVFAVTALRGDPEEGLLRGLSVVLIACPCALAIAPSLVVVSSMRHAARRGVLFATAALVERAAALRFIFFDKTGTLTTSVTEIVSVKVTAGVPRAEVLQLLASIESGSNHPIARGLVAYAAGAGVPPARPEMCRVIPGLGVEARLGGRSYRIGGARLAAEAGFPRHEEGAEELYLLEGRRLLARIRTRDRVRDDAAQAIARLRSLSIDLAGLSGDHPAPTARLAESLGIPIEAGLLPADKLNRMSQIRGGLGSGETVGMVGDGINDAPALARADVGFALAGGTDLSKQSGHVLLVGDRLTGIADAVHIARRARRRLRTILAWAFAYNGVGLLLAATGRLHPAFAATAMVFSSLLVIGYARNAGAAGAADDGGEAERVRENDGAPGSLPEGTRP